MTPQRVFSVFIAGLCVASAAYQARDGNVWRAIWFGAIGALNLALGVAP